MVIKPRRLIWAGNVARMEWGRNAFKILTGTPAGRPRRKWEDNIKMDLKEIVINTRNLVDSAQDSVYRRALGMRHWNSGFHKPWSYLLLTILIRSFAFSTLHLNYVHVHASNSSLTLGKSWEMQVVCMQVMKGRSFLIPVSYNEYWHAKMESGKATPINLVALWQLKNALHILAIDLFYLTTDLVTNFMAYGVWWSNAVLIVPGSPDITYFLMDKVCTVRIIYFHYLLFHRRPTPKLRFLS